MMSKQSPVVHCLALKKCVPKIEQYNSHKNLMGKFFEPTTISYYLNPVLDRTVVLCIYNRTCHRLFDSLYFTIIFINYQHLKFNFAIATNHRFKDTNKINIYMSINIEY